MYSAIWSLKDHCTHTTREGLATTEIVTGLVITHMMLILQAYITQELDDTEASINTSKFLGGRQCVTGSKSLGGYTERVIHEAVRVKLKPQWTTTKLDTRGLGNT